MDFKSKLCYLLKLGKIMEKLELLLLGRKKTSREGEFFFKKFSFLKKQKSRLAQLVEHWSNSQGSPVQVR